MPYAHIAATCHICGKVYMSGDCVEHECFDCRLKRREKWIAQHKPPTKKAKPRPKFSDAQIEAWVKRHDLRFGGSVDARCAFEDAASTTPDGSSNPKLTDPAPRDSV